MHKRIFSGEDFLFLPNSLRSYLLSLFLHFGLIILFFSLFLSWFDYLIGTFEIYFGSFFERLLRLLVFYLEYGLFLEKVRHFVFQMYVQEKQKNLSFKLNLCIQKTKIMASGPMTSWQVDGEKVETVADFIFWAPKSLKMLTAAMKLKDVYSLEGKL